LFVEIIGNVIRKLAAVILFYVGIAGVKWSYGRKIWHPKYGVIFDEWENLKSGKYGAVDTEDYCKKKDSSQPFPKYIQMLFPLPARI